MGSGTGKKLCPLCMNSANEAEMVPHLGKMVCPSCASTLVKSQDASIQKEAEPAPDEGSLRLQVKVKNLTVTMSGPMVNVGGKGELFVDAEGLRLNHNGMDFDLAWEDVRELKDNLQTKHSFDANWGNRKYDGRMRITVDSNDAPNLIKAFARMPREAIGSRCPHCPGVCIDGICRKCGRRASTWSRLSGIFYLVGGCIVAGAGIALTLSSKEIAKPGERYILFKGLVASGAFLFFKGLVRLIMGRRS